MSTSRVLSGSLASCSTRCQCGNISTAVTSRHVASRPSSWTSARQLPKRFRAYRLHVTQAAATDTAARPARERPAMEKLELSAENVEMVLDEIRPYLISDGGNVALDEIDGPVVHLRLQGACGSCPSSMTTMTMGIKRRLIEKIPEILDVQQIAEEEVGLELTAENVEVTLDEIRLKGCIKVLASMFISSLHNVNDESRTIYQPSWGVMQSRPYLVGASGGGLELVELAGPVVKIRITGPAAKVMTVRVAVTQKLREKIPSIAAVQLMN